MGGWLRVVREPALIAACLLFAQAAGAQDYPNRNIRVVVPFGPAGVTDVVARIVFDRVGQTIGQTIVIDNRPGAGGTIAVDHVAQSPADGYTLIMADPSGSLPANVTLYPKLPFDPLKHLTPVAIIGTTGAVLLIADNVPAKSVQELVALAKSKPGELTFASTGNGTPGHLNGELFSRLAGIKAVHVPYRLVSQATTDIVAGRLSFWISPIPTNLQQIRAGHVRALAVAGDARSADLPGIPTVKEAGLGDFDASTTYALFAPAGTPREVISKLNAHIKGALDVDAVQQKMRAAGVEPKIGSPDELGKLLASRIPQWAAVIKAAGITVE
jgi:tripartite-type tricarboxylate transporter receptor subunit TctC